MSMYAAKIIDGAVAETYASMQDLRSAHPATAFPQSPGANDLAAVGCVLVAPTEQPSYDPATQKVVAAPALDGDTWRQQWSVVALSDAERRARIPSVVSRKQARMALVLSGVPLAAVQSAIDAIVDDTERALAQIAWDDAVEFRRDDPFLVAMATALSLTESQLDDLYTLAATL